MQRPQGKENKEQRSLVPITDDKPLSIDVLKKSAVKRLPFSNSPVKHNALVVMKGKGEIRKPRCDLLSHQNQQGSTADRH